MIDHIGIAVSDIERARVFYGQAPAPLGYRVIAALSPEQAGTPGVRENYGPQHYVAFVHDPDGVNVEAVCHAPV